MCRMFSFFAWTTQTMCMLTTLHTLESLHDVLVLVQSKTTSSRWRRGANSSQNFGKWCLWRKGTISISNSVIWRTTNRLRHSYIHQIGSFSEARRLWWSGIYIWYEDNQLWTEGHMIFEVYIMWRDIWGAWMTGLNRETTPNIAWLLKEEEKSTPVVQTWVEAKQNESSCLIAVQIQRMYLSTTTLEPSSTNKKAPPPWGKCVYAPKSRCLLHTPLLHASSWALPYSQTHVQHLYSPNSGPPLRVVSKTRCRRSPYLSSCRAPRLRLKLVACPVGIPPL